MADAHMHTTRPQDPTVIIMIILCNMVWSFVLLGTWYHGDMETSVGVTGYSLTLSLLMSA
jgi:hypothetical protein